MHHPDAELHLPTGLSFSARAAHTLKLRSINATHERIDLFSGMNAGRNMGGARV